MIFVLVLATVLVAALAVPHPRIVEEEWNSFKSKFAKVYNNDDEEAMRSSIFHQNLIKIEEHNKLYEQGLSTFKMGVTSFADMTSEEFKAYVNKSIVQVPSQDRSEEVVLTSVNGLPKSVDWRTKNVLTPVKDQGKKCRSGWAFAATGAMEAQYAMKTGKVISLSEQQLIDCSREFFNKGCEGGRMEIAFNYAAFYNMSTEDSYPYKGKDDKCHKVKASPVKVDDIVYLKSDRTNIWHAVSKRPLAVAVHVTSHWHLYKSGVLVDDLCNANKINQGVLLVGYNHDGQYYIIKNSWGSNWGEKGYIRLSYTRPCGVERFASYPHLA